MARQSTQKPVEEPQNLPAIYSRLEEKKTAFTLALAGDAPVDKFIRSIHLSMQKDPEAPAVRSAQPDRGLREGRQ